MPIPFKCPQCGHEGKARDELKGRIVKCPSCKGSIEIEMFAGLDEVLKSLPPPAELTSPPPPVPEMKLIVRKPVVVPPPIPSEPAATPQQSKVSAAAQPEPWLSVFASWPWRKIASALLIVGFLATLFQPPSLLVLVHYLCLLAVVWFAAELVRNRWWKSMPLILSGVLAIAVGIAYYKYVDCYLNTWNERGEDATRHYTDWHWRSGSDQWPYLRHYSVALPNRGLFSADGGFSETGKMHSLWTEHIFSPGKENIAGYELDGYDCDEWGIGCTKKTWYWYGDEITEGEWHLRNK